ncbi:unnamed protein product [Parajaminaea phylloscopi]
MADGLDLEQRLKRLCVDQDQIHNNNEDLIQAFETGASEHARALATMVLSRTAAAEPGIIARDYARRLLNRAEGHIDDQKAALRFLSVLSVLSPPDARKLLFEGSALRAQVFPRLGEANSSLDLLRVEVLLALSNDAQTRTDLTGDGSTLAWLEVMTKEHDAEPTQATQSTRTVLIALLVLWKLHKGSITTNVIEADAAQQKRSSAWTALEPRWSDSIYRLSRLEILQVSQRSLDDEESKIATLGALESLSYITVDGNVKQRLVSDEELLEALLSLTTRLGSSAGRRAVFPARKGQSEGELSLSSYEVDVSVEHGKHRSQQPDSSVQFALSTILLNLVSYRPILSDDERKINKLRAMATAAKAGSDKTPSRSDHDTELASGDANEEVDARVDILMKHGCIRTLVGLTFPGAGPTPAGMGQSLNSSRAVKSDLAAIFLHLTRSHDKQRRGAIVQAGGAKALVALSSDALARISPSQNDGEHKSSATVLDAPQALARLCITASPAILFGSPSGAVAATVPYLSALFSLPSASPLQRFEALLALTNVASLGPEAAQAVGSSKAGPGNRQPSSTQPAQVPTIAEGVEEVIMLDENAMVRRAAIELLCNLLQADPILSRWAGDEEGREPAEADKSPCTGDDSLSRDVKDEKLSRSRRRLHLLTAFCAPWDASQRAQSQETSLPTRMASAGALAMLCSSPVACKHLLSLRPRTLNILARLITPGTAVTASARKEVPKIQEIVDDPHSPTTTAQGLLKDEDGTREDEDIDEVEEARWEQLDADSWPQGAAHARASLALRGVTVSHCLAQYIAWKGVASAGGSEAARKLDQSGIMPALKAFAVAGAREMQQAESLSSGKDRPALEARSIRLEGTKLALEALKLLMGR